MVLHRTIEPVAALVAILGASLALSSCGGTTTDAAAAVEVRDSAGIRIVENGGAPPSVEWTAEEVVAIGELDGPAEYTFNRVVELDVAADGRVYVLDAGDAVVRVYDPDGRHLTTFGGEGEGPSEFQAAARLRVVGDTVVVYDYRIPKLAHFTLDGELIRTERPELTVFQHGFASVLGPIPGGWLVATGSGCSLPRPEDLRAKWKLYVMGDDGAIRDTLASLARRDVHPIYGETFCTSLPALGGPGHEIAISDDGIVAYGTGERYEVRLFRLDADEGSEAPATGIGSWALPDPFAIVRRGLSPDPVTGDRVQAHRDEIIETRLRDEETGTIDRDRLAAYEAAWDSAAAPEHWPPITRLAWDDAGGLWVEQGGDPDAETRRWNVFDPDGRYLGDVVLPAGLAVHAVGETVWGVTRDELDVQSIRAYRVGPLLDDVAGSGDDVAG